MAEGPHMSLRVSPPAIGLDVDTDFGNLAALPPERPIALALLPTFILAQAGPVGSSTPVLYGPDKWKDLSGAGKVWTAMNIVGNSVLVLGTWIPALSVGNVAILKNDGTEANFTMKTLSFINLFIADDIGLPYTPSADTDLHFSVPIVIGGVGGEVTGGIFGSLPYMFRHDRTPHIPVSNGVAALLLWGACGVASATENELSGEPFVLSSGLAKGVKIEACATAGIKTVEFLATGIRYLVNKK